MDELSDLELLAKFRDTSLPREHWLHRTHIRIAWLYLKEDSFAVAVVKIGAAIRAFNEAKGVPEGLLMGYHETTTHAWMHLVDFTMRQHGATEDSLSFLAAQPHLGQKTLLRLYYSRERFCTEQAKRDFVPPDLADLPRVGG